MLSATALRASRAASIRSMTAAAMAVRAKHTLPPLPYDFGALEPAISGEIMQIHYTKHHQTYVNNLNAALEKLEEATAKNDVSAQIALQGALKFNGGGHINHSIFWENLAPVGKGGEPSDKLMSLIKARFGTFESFQTTFSADSAAVQGSGWGWLAYDKKAKAVTIQTCANQDPLQATTGLVPLLGVDVWEHAYYLQYKNVRPDYLKAVWSVINWSDVNKRLDAAL